jgi:chromate transporter
VTDATDEPALSTVWLFWRFFKFGLFAWGGPVAQVGMIKRELVDEERLAGLLFGSIAP